MTDELVFTLALAVVIAGWSLLLAGYFGAESGPWGPRLIDLGGLWIPLLLASAHAVMLVMSFVAGGTSGSLFSLDGVIVKFADHDRLFLLYLEGMLFSLFIGRWIVLDGTDRRSPKLLVVPLLLMQSILGPPALALWLALRSIGKRRTRGEMAT